MEQKLEFKKLIGPFGIPVYYHPVPSVIKAVSMNWVVFTGSADDTSVGAPGLYHWFEHVPFRGTRNYPGGIQEMHKRIMRVGGRLNAHTGRLKTVYETLVPLGEWKYGLSVITDLFAQPLLKEEDIIKEREIIFQEIARSRGSAQGWVNHEMPHILNPNHPFGHHVLGSEASLMSITPDVLTKAHRLGYDRSRIALVVCGAVNEQELLIELNKLAHMFPDNGLTPRTSGAYHGPLPAWNVSTIEIETGFSESIVRLLFHAPQEQSARETIIRDVALGMFSFGSLSSPFMRILREDRNLIYTGGMIGHSAPGGGYIGFHAQAKKENITAVVKALEDVLADPEIRSPERLELIKEGKKGQIDLSPFDVSDKADDACEEIVEPIGIISDDHRRILLDSITIDEVLHELNLFALDRSKLVVFKGMGH